MLLQLRSASSAGEAVTFLNTDHRIESSRVRDPRMWQIGCTRRGSMHTGAPGAVAQSVTILALMEATRVTGVARNVLEYAKLAAGGIGGLRIAFTFGLIRRGPELPAAVDGLAAAALDAGIPVEVLRERHRYDTFLLDALRRLAASHGPALVETHHVKSHCLLAASGLWRRHKWVAFHHGYTQTNVKVRAYNQLDRWSLRHADHVVTTNYRFARMLEARGVARSRITVLHNAVRDMRTDAGEVSALRRKLGLETHDRVVLCVGRLSHEKGHAYLIRAARSWRGRARLVIAGEGPDRPRLERLAHETGCTDSVVFAGLTSSVAPFYAMADVFVLPSLSEGSPNVLLEAMAAGLPIVATEAGGIPEIAVDGVTGLLVPPRDVDALACAVNALLENRSRGARLAAVAKSMAGQRYTPERRAAVLAAVYTKVLETTTGAAPPPPLP